MLNHPANVGEEDHYLVGTMARTTNTQGINATYYENKKDVNNT